MQRDPLTERVIACAIEVHRELGPGLLESAYAECLAEELSRSGVRFQRERLQAVRYKGTRLAAAYRLDFVVEERVVVEVKAVERLADVHVAQVLTYLRLSGLPVGLLINFHASKLVEGLKRFVR
ncbi:MAG: GxxExxY protein [Planctomycetes bacterium]|nr:GxxExxY protein [Planctomycetota bacterium]